MTKKLRVIMNGLGNVGKTIIREASARGVEFVAGVDQWDQLYGKDLGEHANLSKLGITIEADLKAAIERTKPDLVIFATKTALVDIEAELTICIEQQVNVLTTSEHAYFWQITTPTLGGKIHEAAKAAGVTIFAGGVQDIFWGALPYALSGAAQQVERIVGECVALVDDYGIGVMQEAMVGLSTTEFEQLKNKPQSDEHLDPFTISLYALADKLGLQVTTKQTAVSPLYSENEIYCRAFDRNIPVGQTIGNAYTTTLTTMEGIELSCVFKSKLAEPGDSGSTSWELFGTPHLSLKVDEMHGDITTVTSLINRIPDVVNMTPGFITINDMPTPFYRSKSLGNYVK